MQLCPSVCVRVCACVCVKSISVEAVKPQSQKSTVGRRDLYVLLCIGNNHESEVPTNEYNANVEKRASHCANARSAPCLNPALANTPGSFSQVHRERREQQEGSVTAGEARPRRPGDPPAHHHHTRSPTPHRRLQKHG